MLGMGTQGREMERGKGTPRRGHNLGKGVVAGNSWDMQGFCAVWLYQSLKLQAWNGE